MESLAATLAGPPLVGLGQTCGPDSARVGAVAVREALSLLTPGDPPAWALAFAGGRHDGARILSAFRQGLGDVPVVGGAAMGTITRDAVGYSGFECAVAVFPASLGVPAILVEPGLEEGEGLAGERLGRRIREVADEGSVVILLYDSVRRPGPPPALHAGSRLVDGIYEGLDGRDVHLIGGGTTADIRLSDSYVFDGAGCARHAVVAVVLPSALAAETAILRGCVPASAFLEVTRAEGAVIYELDRRPALEALERMLGGPIDGRRAGELSLRVILGEKHGDPFAPYDESAYVNRLIVSVDPRTGSLTLFEADFRAGARVQFMSHDNDVMLASVERGTAELMGRLAGKACAFGVYVDWVGRSGLVSGSSVEEAGVMVRHCRADIPVLGFFSGGEVAPVMGRSRPLDWTGVLSVIYRNRK